MTPLAAAAGAGRAVLLDYLLTRHADVNARTLRGDTPLLLGASTGDTHVVDKLLAAGADKDAQNVFGDTALMVASRNGDAPIVRRLLEGGVDRTGRRCRRPGRCGRCDDRGGLCTTRPRGRLRERSPRKPATRRRRGSSFAARSANAYRRANEVAPRPATRRRRPSSFARPSVKRTAARADGGTARG